MQPTIETTRTALVLTGGGARGAYQAGALAALAEICGSGPMPFSILHGVSVGGLNTIGLASLAPDFDRGACCIRDFWRSLETRKVVTSGLGASTRAFARLLRPLYLHRLGKLEVEPYYIFDTGPMREAISATIDATNVHRVIERGMLHAVSVSCSSYATGHSVTFFDGAAHIPEWARVRREGRRTILDVPHAMASASLPFLFRPVEIANEYFGDGTLRQTSPLAPAIHLGADRLLVISTRDPLGTDHVQPTRRTKTPLFADLAGYTLDTIFHDSVDADIERLGRINALVSSMSRAQRNAASLKNIDTLLLAPSSSLRAIAREHEHMMPLPYRAILRREQSGQAAGRVESYLMFEPPYLNALVDLGFADTLAKADEVRRFLDPTRIVEKSL